MSLHLFLELWRTFCAFEPDAAKREAAMKRTVKRIMAAKHGRLN